jgi:hypothetical protein
MSTRESREYRDNWRKYRKIRIAFWVSFASLALGVALVYWAAPKNMFPPDLLDLALIVFAIPYLITYLKWAHWRCPRCGNFFSGVWWSTSRCVFCGLRKFASTDQD